MSRFVYLTLLALGIVFSLGFLAIHLNRNPNKKHPSHIEQTGPHSETAVDGMSSGPSTDMPQNLHQPNIVDLPPKDMASLAFNWRLKRSYPLYLGSTVLLIMAVRYFPSSYFKAHSDPDHRSLMKTLLSSTSTLGLLGAIFLLVNGFGLLSNFYVTQRLANAEHRLPGMEESILNATKRLSIIAKRLGKFKLNDSAIRDIWCRSAISLLVDKKLMAASSPLVDSVIISTTKNGKEFCIGLSPSSFEYKKIAYYLDCLSMRLKAPGEFSKLAFLSYQDLLGVLAKLEYKDDQVSCQLLKEHYRKLSKIYHPDVKFTGSQEKFIELRENYELVEPLICKPEKYKLDGADE